eukprot:362825-Chlamydomonas_euryale.AAC.1
MRPRCTRFARGATVVHAHTHWGNDELLIGTAMPIPAGIGRDKSLFCTSANSFRRHGAPPLTLQSVRLTVRRNCSN